MFCEMSPPIETSIRKVSQDCWVLGSGMICERNGAQTESCVASWSDDSGSIFRLRTENNPTLQSVDAACGMQDRIHFAGTSAAVWKIGNVYCKVKSYVAGMEYEADTISFVRSKASTIPLPEVIYTWVDEKLCRTFLLLRQIKGRTLAECWSSLSPYQHTNIAATIARFCKLLAQNSSPSLQSISGLGVLDSFLTKRPPHSRPSWMPYPLGPLRPGELADYLHQSQPTTLLEIPEKFYFHHSDLGPTNIMISKEGSVDGVLDWESAGYYPWFWIATKPLISAGFNLPLGSENRYAWAELLTKALELEGFEQALGQFKGWEKAVESLNTASSCMK
ncbi:hypothetical protein FKW77_001885 [Venturia effusa]|uniref:Aminoglycoside phosphotransferase domain-containing protein n=1 Tax=Venturia effusa TaxID=50376 RepID=A0A517LRJ1_9PEZI|nr:hypothetical protein FKW77_001885 [Venturia effusa]